MKKLLELQRPATVGARALEHLALMEAYVREMSQATDEDLQRAADVALLSGGKRLRPTLAFLAASFGEMESDDIVPLMAMIEMMHTGSLVHDDVVDNSPLRRGQKTVNALYGDHFAVQCADYVLARTMVLFGRYRGTEINAVLADTSMEMCRGELRQLQVEYDLAAQTREDYFTRIKQKTAYLISAACHTGAIAAGLCATWREALREYGLRLGIAFQLGDDILDYDMTEYDGKPSFQDLSRGIYTLPLLCAVEKAPSPRLLSLLDRRRLQKREKREILRWIEDAGGIAHTRALAGRYVDGAVESLSPLPDGEAKELLIQTARSVR